MGLQVAAQRGHERSVGSGGTLGGRAPQDERVGAPRHIGEQPRLPDAGLAAHQRDRALVRTQELLQPSLLGLPSHEARPHGLKVRHAGEWKYGNPADDPARRRP